MHLSIFKATSDPDTMYLHEAMKQPDADEFRQAMQKEQPDLCTGCKLEFHSNTTDHDGFKQVAHKTNRLRPGIPSGAS